MNTATIAENYVKEWYQKKGKKVDIDHRDGYDLKSKNGDLYVEVKGSTKEKFNDFRPYFTLSELEKAIDKGKRYKIHILLGIKNGGPKTHKFFDGTCFSKYKTFAQDASKFVKKWGKSDEEILKLEVRVYLKKLPPSHLIAES